RTCSWSGRSAWTRVAAGALRREKARLAMVGRRLLAAARRDHLYLGRQAGNHRTPWYFVERDANGDALGYLDPVARRILGGQHRKFAPGSGADRLDVAAHDEPRIGVEAHFGRLADAHVSKVGFLEIGLDPWVRCVDQGDRGQPRDHH